jgi:hypothetical protein
VFEKFRQPIRRPRAPHAGLGLGLAIVRRLAELHGGASRRRAKVKGEGSTFTVTLPVAPVAASPSADGKSESPDDVTLDGLYVLVVDDDADSLMLAAVALEQHGAHVTTARSGRRRWKR